MNEELIARVNAARPALLKAGLQQVTVDYDGSGDSGDVNYVGGTPDLVWAAVKGVLAPAAGDGSQPSAFDDGGKPQTIEDMFIELCWGALEDYESGWENNDGAYGQLVYTVATGQATLEHNSRITDVIYNEYDLPMLEDPEVVPSTDPVVGYVACGHDRVQSVFCRMPKGHDGDCQGTLVGPATPVEG